MLILKIVQVSFHQNELKKDAFLGILLSSNIFNYSALLKYRLIATKESLLHKFLRRLAHFRFLLSDLTDILMIKYDII